jgi:hypothetical protein
MIDNDEKWLEETFRNSLPRITNENVWQWCEKHFVVVGSARTEIFNIDTAPWLKEPFECLTDGVTNTAVVVAPAQSGKSLLGECAMCYWIGTEPNGPIQYNWETDNKGKQRWTERVKPILKACDVVASLWPKTRAENKECHVVFPHLFFTMQGVEADKNLESSSIRFQINEEIHEWAEGRLRLADKRLMAYWNSFQLNISTGGMVGDQLHQRWESSTKRRWLEQCPKCGGWQAFHVRKKKDVLGGLCYDLEGSTSVDGVIDYDKLEQSIFYECEHCGFHMLDNMEERRQRSLKGKYEEYSGKPKSQGYTYENVSVYWVKWMLIVQEKIEAYAALRRGNLKQWITYIQRVEAGFWDPENRPLAELVTVTKGAKMGEGLPNRQIRAMTVDYQHGSVRTGMGEHFKIIIRDWTSELDSQLVFEGVALSDIDLDDIRAKYEVDPAFVMIDCGYQGPYIHQVCWKYGYLAVKGASSNNAFKYETETEDGKKTYSYRQYSNMRTADPFTGDQEGREGRYKIQWLFYCPDAIRDILEMIRAQHNWIVPEDVSEQYKKEILSEEIRDVINPTTGRKELKWCKVSSHAQNDYFVCEAYQALMITIMSDCGLFHLTEELKPRKRELDKGTELNNA